MGVLLEAGDESDAVFCDTCLCTIAPSSAAQKKFRSFFRLSSGLSGAGSDEALACRFTGSRLHKRIDLRVEFPGAGKGSIVFEPARLEKPNAAIPDAEWAKVELPR